MRKKWVGSLVSRLHGSDVPLTLEVWREEGEEVIEGILRTGGGEDGFVWSIEEGVPRFYPSVGDEFGSKWKEWNELGGWDSGRNRESAELQFCSTLGVDSLLEAASLFADGSNWLDAGCGIGQAESLFNLNPKANRFAVDLSPMTAKIAYERTRHLPNVFVAQGNILSLPFRKGFFDGIFSIGVLHHTLNPRLFFHILCDLLRPGGLIGIYVYCMKPLVREMADEIVRSFTTGMGKEGCLEFSKQMTELGKAFSDIEAPLVVTKAIPLLGIEKGEYNLQKFVYDHFLKCYYNPDMGWGGSDLTNFDWYHPKHASHHTREEIEEWFGENGVEDVEFIQPEGWEHSGYFVSGRKGRR